MSTLGDANEEFQGWTPAVGCDSPSGSTSSLIRGEVCVSMCSIAVSVGTYLCRFWCILSRSNDVECLLLRLLAFGFLSCEMSGQGSCPVLFWCIICSFITLWWFRTLHTSLFSIRSLSNVQPRSGPAFLTLLRVSFGRKTH